MLIQGSGKLNIIAGHQCKKGFILHFHGKFFCKLFNNFIQIGGGMVIGNAEQGNSYLVPWSKLTGLPILSVNYSLSPEAKYPVAINECVKVYQWLLQNRHQIGLSTDKIIVAGVR